ncbi:MAG: phospholipase D family protein [Planctomycetia bacterium]|nr:phospholipase D family protein [Planctomycetia bacterium]
MPGVNVELLFALPRNEVFTRINGLIAQSTRVSAVVGFLTEAGVALLGDALQASPGVLDTLVVGAITLKACDGLDRLLTMGVPADRLLVHLGHSRPTKESFTKYHPMMHSKVYLFEGAQSSAAIVGSHNMTGFALGGQNTEASVLIQGPIHHPLFTEIRTHIQAVKSESQVYNPTMRIAYAWWFRELFKGMQYKALFGDGEEGIEYRRNVVAIAIASNSGTPQIGDVIYLEVPIQFAVLKALDEPVHFYLLSQLPQTVAEATVQLPLCTSAFRGKVAGTNQKVVDRGFADWIIRDLRNPVLERTAGTVNVAGSPGFIQAFIEIHDVLRARYEYIFDTAKRWKPVYDESLAGQVSVTAPLAKRFAELELIPAEHIPWNRVIDLEPEGEPGDDSQALRETSPDSGRFLLLSRRRRPLDYANRSTAQAEQLVLPGAVASIEVERISPESSPAPDDQKLIEAVQGIPAEVWFATVRWAKPNSKLAKYQQGIAASLGRQRKDGKVPSIKQAIQGQKLLLEAIEKGFADLSLSNDVLESLRNIKRLSN